MAPADFRSFVFGIADRIGFPHDRIILGGDHLGPNPWKHLPAAAAMAKAEDMIAAYAAAGFEKLHLDASMGCQDEPSVLSDEVIAGRAVRLAARAEAAAAQGTRPGLYHRHGSAYAGRRHRGAGPSAADAAGGRARDLCGARGRLSRGGARGLAARAGDRRAARSRVRPRGCRDLPAREGRRTLGVAAAHARPRVRGAFHRLPAGDRPCVGWCRTDSRS